MTEEQIKQIEEVSDLKFIKHEKAYWRIPNVYIFFHEKANFYVEFEIGGNIKQIDLVDKESDVGIECNAKFFKDMNYICENILKW